MTTIQYKIENFNITLSQIDDNIYIKVVDNISFQTYENNVDFNDIVLPFDKNDIFNIISDCFSSNKVSFLVRENNVKITFDIIFNSKYKYNFEVVLIEKNVKSDVKSECQYIKEINDLKKELESLKIMFNNEIKSLKNNQEKNVKGDTKSEYQYIKETNDLKKEFESFKIMFNNEIKSVKDNQIKQNLKVSKLCLIMKLKV